MELVWLEDFLELVATRNYMAAASARHISQSAFSRRIMALENWVGAPLVDRSTYPVKLTKAGLRFMPRCQELVQDLYRLREECQQEAGATRMRLSFSALHTIAMFQFPRWLCGLEESLGSIMASMHAGDFRECLEQLSLGKCDFAMMYDHKEGPPVLSAGPFVSLPLGTEMLVPVSAVAANGRPLHDFDPGSDKPVPHLAYSWNDGYIGRIVSLIQKRQKHAYQFTTVYESALAEGIKRMAMAGKGVGWLPYSCVADAIGRGELVIIGGPELQMEMELRIYRRQGLATVDVEDFWQELLAGQPAAPAMQHIAARTRRGSAADIFHAKMT